MKLHLSDSERAGLEQMARLATSARVVRRAQTLLWLDAGESISAIAMRHHICRQTVYNWIAHFQAHGHTKLLDRLDDHPHGSRPPSQREAARQVLENLMDQDPISLGYRSPVWTTPLLHHHLNRVRGVGVSMRTIRRTLHLMGYRYKRPRFVLSRRSPTWRQSKGGSSEA